MELRQLPALNAFLNSVSFVLLVWGYTLIRRRRFQAHKRVMLAACATSVLFLTSYLIYHYNVGSVKFQPQGPIRLVYFTILISHTLLAVVVAPLAIITLYRAWTDQLARHRKLARITLPLWLYVSATGVVVYLMLYHL
jgi:uncharacterized membrane protein YozB (DUF420 family)